MSSEYNGHYTRLDMASSPLKAKIDLKIPQIPYSPLECAGKSARQDAPGKNPSPKQSGRNSNLIKNGQLYINKRLDIKQRLIV